MCTILCGKVLWQTFQFQNCSNSHETVNGPKYTLSLRYAISSFCSYTNKQKRNWIKTFLAAHQASPCGNESTVGQRWQKHNAQPQYTQWSGHAVIDEIPVC